MLAGDLLVFLMDERTASLVKPLLIEMGESIKGRIIMKILKEVCVENLAEALEAEKRGADRIELCDNLSFGGTTQSYGTIKKALEKLKIPVFPIIRPRGGDFFYTEDEIEIMKEDVKMCKSLGAEGVVLGMLTKDKKIDFSLVKEFVSLHILWKLHFIKQ